jgi:hypothetical protein
VPTSSPTPAQRVRTGLAVVGAAALLVGGVNVMAHAADTAESLLLGKNNTAGKSTTLKNKGKGPALKLKAKKGPALAVNTKDLVKNLNVEMVGGRTAGQLAPAATTFTLPSGPTFAPGANFQQFQLPAGTYELNLNVAVQTSNSDYFVSCLVADASLFTPPLDPAKVYAGFNVSPDGDATIVNGTRVITFPAVQNVTFGCIVGIVDSEPVSVVQPFTVTVQQISGNVAGSSTPMPVSRQQARAAAAATR